MVMVLSVCWVCLRGKDEDLKKSDQRVADCIDLQRCSQDYDNYHWTKDAEKNQLVVGSKARILYADGPGRVKIALAFNQLVRKGSVGTIMLGRDRHDTGCTDSPFRETANIKDGSILLRSLSHCFARNVARGMTLAVQSNGGGVGIGKCFNCGFGLVLVGSEKIDEVIKSSLDWDVYGAVARRAWARNRNRVNLNLYCVLTTERRKHENYWYCKECR